MATVSKTFEASQFSLTATIRIDNDGQDPSHDDLWKILINPFESDSKTIYFSTDAIPKGSKITNASLYYTEVKGEFGEYFGIASTITSTGESTSSANLIKYLNSMSESGFGKAAIRITYYGKTYTKYMSNQPSTGLKDSTCVFYTPRLVVTYEGAQSDTVSYGEGGSYKKCAVFYAIDGVWKQCKALFGADGSWKDVE